MSNDRRTFLDGSTAPRKPLPAPLTEGAMKAAMEDWLEALPKPAVKEFFGVQKKFPNPKDKKTVDAKNLEILKKYKVKPLIGDPSHRESLGALSCCLDMLVGGQGESVEVDGDSIEEVMGEAKKIKYPEDLQYKNHRDMTPAEKQRWIAWSRAYNQGVQTRDFSGVETSPSLGTKSKEYQDAWKAWNRQRTIHAANRDFHLIKPFVAPKEKTKTTKKESVTTTEAKNYAKMSDKSIVSAEMQTILSLAMQTLQGAMGEQDMTDVRYTKRVGIEINSERHEQLMLALEREVKKGGSKLQMWGRKKGQGVG